VNSTSDRSHCSSVAGDDGVATTRHAAAAVLTTTLCGWEGNRGSLPLLLMLAMMTAMLMHVAAVQRRTTTSDSDVTEHIEIAQRRQPPVDNIGTSYRNRRLHDCGILRRRSG